MSLVGPQPVTRNPLMRLAADLRSERAVRVPFPRGDTGFSMRRTHRVLVDPLGLLLDAYAEHGPVFTLRLFHSPVVWMLGPEANHYMTVSHASQFSWREGNMGDLIPLLGDGLLTIDGDFHRRSRRIMLPAFHHERIAELRDRWPRTSRPRCRPGDRATSSTSTTGRVTWRCASPCARCSASTPTARPRGSTPPSSSRPR